MISWLIITALLVMVYYSITNYRRRYTFKKMASAWSLASYGFRMYLHHQFSQRYDDDFSNNLSQAISKFLLFDLSEDVNIEYFALGHEVLIKQETINLKHDTNLVIFLTYILRVQYLIFYVRLKAVDNGFMKHVDKLAKADLIIPELPDPEPIVFISMAHYFFHRRYLYNE